MHRWTYQKIFKFIRRANVDQIIQFKILFLGKEFSITEFWLSKWNLFRFFFYLANRFPIVLYLHKDYENHRILKKLCKHFLFRQIRLYVKMLYSIRCDKFGIPRSLKLILLKRKKNCYGKSWGRIYLKHMWMWTVCYTILFSEWCKVTVSRLTEVSRYLKYAHTCSACLIYESKNILSRMPLIFFTMIMFRKTVKHTYDGDKVN